MWGTPACVADPYPVRKGLQANIYAQTPFSSQGHIRHPTHGVRVAGNTPMHGVPVHPAPPPSYERHVSHEQHVSSPSAAGGGVQNAGGSSTPSEMKPELRRHRWVTFVLGNTISAFVIIYEMTQLAVCFDEYVGDLSDDESLDSTEREDQVEYEALLTRDIVMFTLAFSLVVEVVSAIVLSVTYKSPLDIKSVHKIPPDDLRNCCATMTMFFLAPFSWALIYVLGGLSSMFYSFNSSCEGVEGDGIVLYLQVSGVLMVFGGVMSFGVSAFSVWLSCGSCTRQVDGCCHRAREAMSKQVLTKGLFIDTFWMVQGVVWSLRTGAFGQDASVVLGLASVLGEGLAAFGSVALDVADCFGGCL